MATTKASTNTGRPKRPPTLATHFAKSAILEAAAEVFGARGIPETRVEDLIAAAGISRRTFYKYFGSKEEVLAALYELVTGNLLELLRGLGDEAGPSLAAIRAGVDAYLDFHAVNGRLLRLLVEHAIQSDSLLYPRRRWLREELVKLLDEAARREGGRRRDPMVFYALVSALEGLSLHLLETNAGEDEIERAKKVVHAVAEALLV